jgi:hypothetical protein
MMDLSRRELCTGFAALWLGFGMAPRLAEAGESDASVALLSLLPDRAEAAAIGSAWLDQEGLKSRPPAGILASLTQRLQRQGWSGAADPAELRKRLAAAVQADFSDRAVVSVEGWQIARTQAELCALAYFSTTGSL